jgi:hypothetical protein
MNERGAGEKGKEDWVHLVGAITERKEVDTV